MSAKESKTLKQIKSSLNNDSVPYNFLIPSKFLKKNKNPTFRFFIPNIINKSIHEF